MICKFCNGQLEEEVAVCPLCGRDLTENAEQAPLSEEEVSQEVTYEAEETQADATEEATEAIAEEVPVPKKNTGRILIAAICGAILVVILAAAILMGSGKTLLPQGEGIFYKSSYTVKDAVAVRKADQVIARVNGKELTNAELQAHYFGNMYQFLNSYGSNYFSYNKALDSQVYSSEDGKSWQQYFIESALINWHRYQILLMLAEEQGVSLEEPLSVDIMSELEAAAATYGFESVEDMIHSDIGTSCDPEDYIRYIQLVNAGNYYVDQLYTDYQATEEELEAFYRDNEQAFIDGGLSKNDGNIVDVRHILIKPKGEAVEGVYTDAQWAEALAEAERIHALWKKDPTEDNFAALASEYTEDTGSKTTGGLYTNITPEANLVPNFLSWCVDAARVVGDTAIVETEYGYHIMYFSKTEPIWVVAARDNITPYLLNNMMVENEARWPLEVIYRNIVVTDNNVSG